MLSVAVLVPCSGMLTDARGTVIVGQGLKGRNMKAVIRESVQNSPALFFFCLIDVPDLFPGQFPLRSSTKYPSLHLPVTHLGCLQGACPLPSTLQHLGNRRGSSSSSKSKDKPATCGLAHYFVTWVTAWCFQALLRMQWVPDHPSGSWRCRLWHVFLTSLGYKYKCVHHRMAPRSE